MIKDRLKECRIQCGYSQKQIADELKIHRSTYSYYELGKTEPSLDNIRELAKMFNVSLYYILEMDPPDPVAVRDPGYGDDYGYLNADNINRVGDLTREEKKLIMRFRLMTESQRRELLDVISNPGGDESKE